MKKGLIIIFITSLLLSCSEGSDEFTSPVQAQLNGTWQVIEYSFEGRSTTVDFDGSSFYDFTGLAGNMDLFMTFEESGEYSSDGYYYLENMVVTDAGENYYWINFHTIDEIGDWEISGNVIDIAFESDDRSIGISELTETTMILRVNSNTSEIAADNMTTTTVNKNETYVLERQ